MLGAKSGYPTFLRDDDIEVDLPSDNDLTSTQNDDLISSKYLIASIRLARIAGNIISNLYSRKKLENTFSQRVHKIFRDLRNWFETLPEDMQIRNNDSSLVARHIVSLHLSFNQVGQLIVQRKFLLIY